MHISWYQWDSQIDRYVLTKEWNMYIVGGKNGHNCDDKMSGVTEITSRQTM